MEVDTGAFMALRGVAEISAQQLRSVLARGFLAGHRAAERKLWPVIVRLTAHIAAQVIHCAGVMEALDVLFRASYRHGVGDGLEPGGGRPEPVRPAVPATAGPPSPGPLRLIKRARQPHWPDNRPP